MEKTALTNFGLLSRVVNKLGLGDFGRAGSLGGLTELKVEDS